MEQKTKFILIGLIGVSVIMFFLFIQALTSKQTVIRERDNYKAENLSLSSKLEKLDKDLRDKQLKVDSLQTDLNRVAQERDEMAKRFEMVNKTREELIEKMKGSTATSVPATTDAYWAGVLKAKTDLEFQLDKMRSDLKSAQISNEQLQRDKNTLDFDIASLTREKADLGRQLEYNQKLMDSISQELVRERNDKTQIQGTFKSLKNENSVLRRQLKSLNNRKISLERKMQDIEQGKNSVERRLNEMETMLTDRISQINKLRDELDMIRSGAKRGTLMDRKESVELPPIVVRPSQDIPTVEKPGTESTGKVLAVNKDSNFVVIDLGEDSGIRIGDSFSIFRKNESIATIRVIKVSKSVSACDIEREDSLIQIGDIVR